MFSPKNFTWRKWLILMVLIFLITTLVAYLIQLVRDSSEPALGSPALIRRFVISAVIAALFSMTRSEPKD